MLDKYIRQKINHDIYFYVISFLKPIKINSDLDIEIRVVSLTKIIMEFKKNMKIMKFKLTNNHIVDYIDNTIDSINFDKKDIEYFVMYQNENFLLFIDRIFLISSLYKL